MHMSRSQFWELAQSVRKKPGMYFGCSGSKAIVRMARYAVESILFNGADAWFGKLEVAVTNQGRQSVSVCFHGLSYDRLPPDRSVDLFPAIVSGPWNWWIGIIAGASAEFVIECSDGMSRRRLEIQETVEVRDSCVPGDGTVFLRIKFSPVAEHFQTAGMEEYYQIMGQLRDLSMLREGMKTHFTADDLEGEASCYYRDGMKSYLFETDHVRIPQHAGCLHFTAMENDMKVECYLRFVHAGTPRVKNFVNYYPTQGGSHLEGLGKALKELFPDDTKGCRQSRFITNPDINEGVVIPRPFIGIMHIQLKEPRYYAPTRDVLKTEGVAEFVYKAAAETLKEQWEALNPPIDYQAIYRKTMAVEARLSKCSGDTSAST